MTRWLKEFGHYSKSCKVKKDKCCSLWTMQIFCICLNVSGTIIPSNQKNFRKPYLYFMPVFMLCSLEEGTLCTESCPRLRATIATALNLLRVPVLGLLAFCRFSRSSVLRLTPPRWSVHTNDTCILTFGQLSRLQSLLIKTRLWFNQAEQTPRGGKSEGSSRERDTVQPVGSSYSESSFTHTVPLLGITAQSLMWQRRSQCSNKKENKQTNQTRRAGGLADQNEFKWQRGNGWMRT